MNSLKHLILSNVSQNFVKRGCISNFGLYHLKRQLYSPASLKLDSLEDNRSRKITPSFSDSEFMQKMKKIAAPENNDVIFSSDLLKMLSIIKDDEEINTFLSVLKKYAKQNVSIQFSSYKFGPQVMRLFHLLKRPKEAMLMAEDKDFSKLFSPISCKIVLFDLLYENQKYDDIIRLFKQDPLRHRASPLIVIYFAACWKANTKESYKSALEIHQLLQESDQKLPYMAKNYLALLCLEQNNPAAAFEVLENYMRTIPINIKIRALAKAGRFRDIFFLLDKFIKTEKNSPKKSVITSDTISYVSDEMEKANLKENDKTKWNEIFQTLEENYLFEAKTLEEKICEYLSQTLITKREGDNNFRAV